MARRSINIYGTGEEALKFAIYHAGKYRIKAFIDGRRPYPKAFLSGYLGYNVPVYYLDEIDEKVLKDYTVVCSSEAAYREIRDNLINMGLQEFADFEYYRTFEKKIALMYGNCHAEFIKNILSQAPCFSQIYGFYPLKPICQIKSEGTNDLELDIFSKCDLLIHQCIWEKNVYGIEFASSHIVRKAKPSCRIIGLPNLYRMPRFLYPQIEIEDRVAWENRHYYCFSDKYIDAICDSSIDDICSMITDDNFLDYKSIVEEYHVFVGKVKARELEWDIKPSEFIVNNIKKQKLFFDPNHPTNSFLVYIAQNVCGLLNISSTGVEARDSMSLDTYEVPVYHSVHKALGFEYAPPAS